MRMLMLVPVLFVVSACGGGDAAGWEAEYRDRLGALNAAATPAEQVEWCLWARNATDDEIAQLLIAMTGEDESQFDRLMDELGIEPTVEDVERGLAIAVDLAKADC